MQQMTQVLIIGAGPVGLTLANLLISQGMSCLIVTNEATQRPIEQSRAEGNHGRTIALYERLDVLEDAFAQGRPLHGATLHEGDRKLGHITLDNPHSYCPGAIILSQARVERILEHRLEKVGGTLERGQELIALEQAQDGVQATLRSSTGETQTVSATYLVGCDGGRSTTRKLVGATFEGESSPIQYALADVEVNFPGAPLGDDLHIWLSPLMILGRLEGKTWKVAAPTNPDISLTDTPEAIVTAIQEKLDQNGVAAKLHSPRWTSIFRISTRRVNQMRFGRVFLAGDAAHVHSPMGGQGMNEGMQDAVNLAWKLVAVLQGNAKQTLLDTYGAERQPIIEAMLKDTSDMTQILEMPDSPLSKLRNLALSIATSLAWLQPVIREQFAGATRNLRKSSLVFDPDAKGFPQNAPHPGDRAPDAAGIFAEGLGESRRLFTLWRNSYQHELLLFAGEDENQPQRATLSALALAIEERYRGRVRAWVVTRSGKGSGNFLLDSTSDLHNRYEAEKECLYLIRPDGFIATRTLVPKQESITKFFHEMYGW
jgi:2-polyprenyl-6-methoxyphenol hydroxylase-like FAD-dependent oxidoreductase